MSAVESVEKESEEKQIMEFYWTGHPFVDAGLAAILLIAGKSKPEKLNREDIMKAIDFASELYATKEWSSSYIHGMIFPNSGILMANPSMAKKISPEAIAENLLGILDKSSTKESPRCVICGRGRAYPKKEIYLSVFPLLGTGGVPNFFHSANPAGADICAHCVFLTQFMPLASYRLPRVLVIHAYPYELMLEFCRDALNDVRRNKLASQAKGFRRPENFLFQKIGEITRKIERDEIWENASVNLYYFICNNQNQSLDLMHIPNPVLKFVAYASGHPDWKRIVAMGWKVQPKDDEEFENLERERRNVVYSRLLNNESILQFFYNSKERKVNASWNLLSFYCREVMGLDREVLDFIKDVGDRIVDTIENLPENKLGGEVRSLERAERLHQFEAFFIRVEKLRQNLGIERPLMSFDEFARILTAYGEDVNISWRTVKNLLLFRIYERLHDKLMKSLKSNEAGELEFEENELAIYGGGRE